MVAVTNNLVQFLRGSGQRVWSNRKHQHQTTGTTLASYWPSLKDCKLAILWLHLLIRYVHTAVINNIVC